MASRLFVAAFAAVLALVVALSGSTGTVSAHERRVVGDYEFEVGFLVEPASAGNLNGVFMSINYYPDGVPETAGEEEAEGEEGAGGEPVQGADQTLSVTVTVGGGAATTDLEFEPLEEPGPYDAAFIPTLPGEYTFSITGEVDGTQVNETFESGPERFSSVEDAADYEFPAPSGDAGDASADSDSAEDDDSDTAMIVAIVAIILAVIAAAVAIFAVARNRQA
jgi:hypothetical protein